MDNITGSAASQLQSISTKEVISTSHTDINTITKKELNLEKEIENIITSKMNLETKYDEHKDKKIYDAIVSVESALISLCN